WRASSSHNSPRQPNKWRQPMTDATKVGAAHLQRTAYVYLRQSTPHQVIHNRESTQQQYALVSKATNLGWPSQQIVVIDEDLGLSGTGIAQRNGFAQLTAEVALGHVGMCSASKSPVSHATTLTSIACSISAASPIPSSAMLTASIIRHCSTIVCCSGSRER